jgi:hypothetical protein
METASRKRVLVVGLATIDREVVEAIVADDPGVEIVVGDELASRAEFLILGSEEPSVVARFLTDNPGAQAFVFGNHGGQGYLYELAPQRTALGEVSPQLLLDVLRGQRPRPRPPQVGAIRRHRGEQVGRSRTWH